MSALLLGLVAVIVAGFGLALLDVTIVRTPSARQISNAAVATPPPIPQMRAHSPVCTCALVRPCRPAVR